MGLRKSLPECKKIVDAVMKTYPGIPRMQVNAKVKARETGYAETIYGYKRLLPAINSSNRYTRSEDERRAANTPVQGSAADIMKRAQNVGTVTEVYEKAGYFVVTEGNYSNAVKKRTMLINGRYIRGFISPKYTDDTVTPVTPAAGKDLTTVAREVILGVWGNMPERKTKLEASGYNFTDVQNKVNELLNKNVPTPSKPQNTGVTKVVAGSGAASFDKSLAGSYVTTTGLYMRHGAGKNKRAMVLIPEGTKVQNYGYYTSYNGTKWLYIQVTLNGVQYTGFSCKTYLKKQ